MWRRSIGHVHRVAALTGAIVAGVASPATAAPPDDEQQVKRWRAYLNVSPTTFVGLYPMYAYNLDSGGQWTRSRFKLQIGGWFEHALRPGFNYFTLGPILRVGGGSERIFGYGLVRAGFGVIHGFIDDYTRTGIGANGGLGGGLMGSVHPHVALGFEASGELGFADAYVFPGFRARLFVGFVF